MSASHALTALAGGLAAMAILLAVPPRPRLPSRSREAVSAPAPTGTVRWRPLLAAVAAPGGWALVGGYPGLVAGVGAAAAVWIVLGRVEDPAVRQRRDQLKRDLPVAVDLFGACLAAGAGPESALLSSGTALGGPVAEEFTALHHRLQLGLAPAEVWAGVARDPAMAPLGRAMVRTHETGASVETSVRRLAAELRDRAAVEVEERARGIEVRAAAPLGLCLLPSFMLLGVVPMVVSVFSSMRLF